MVVKAIQEAIDKFIPQKMSKTKRHLPWVSRSVKRLMNKRDRAYKKAKRTGKPEHLRIYKQLRNVNVKRLRITHAKYLNEVIGGLSPADHDHTLINGAKRAWSYVKLLLAESTGIPTLFWNNAVCATDSAKVEALREQYESVFTREDLSTMPSLGPSPYPDIPEFMMSEYGIRKQLEKINVDKAACPDHIPARVLKESATELAPVFAMLFQQSYDTGILPAD